MSFPDPLVLIDLETTGANAVTDRITEIAMLRVEGGEIVSRWQSLVNPGQGIPPFIQRIIGISDEMVATAPSFAALADEVRAMLAGAVFVAHNARFDYGFICNEYARLQQPFEAPVLCTVKLSRALYPEHHRHGLDALIERHALVCDARHRAMGDTEVLWQFSRLVRERFAPDVLARACERAMKLPPRPPGLPVGALEGLPDAPGVFEFFGDAGQLLYVGRSASLRARVMEYFATGKRSGKEADIARKVRGLAWQQTAGDFSAMLLESALVRARRPLHNRQPEGPGAAFGLRLLAGRKRAPILQRVDVDDTDPADWTALPGAALHGVFRSRKEADSLLRELVHVYRLCPRRLGIEAGGQGGCKAFQARQCAGVCAGKESIDAHDARLAGALASVGVKAWPWSGPVVIAEHYPAADINAYHVFDQWCLLASVESADALVAQRANLPPRRFDADTWRVLQRWLSVPANTAKVTLLADFSA